MIQNQCVDSVECIIFLLTAMCLDFHGCAAKHHRRSESEDGIITESFILFLLEKATRVAGSATDIRQKFTGFHPLRPTVGRGFFAPAPAGGQGG